MLHQHALDWCQATLRCSLDLLYPFAYLIHNMAKFHGNAYWKTKQIPAALLSIEIWRVVAILLLRKIELMSCPLRRLVSAVEYWDLQLECLRKHRIRHR